MTSHKEIQSLIADIDGVLPKADARLPWSKPGDVAAQRRVLERVRSYLVSLQQPNVGVVQEKRPAPFTSQGSEALQEVVQAVTREISVFQTDLLHSVQAELAALRNERESLLREIRNLEHAKQLGSLPQSQTVQQEIISEFSQQLVGRCTEGVKQQINQILADWEARVLNWEMTGTQVAPRTSWGEVGQAIQPQVTSEQLRQMQVRSDRILTTLDADQQAIFETLERNLQSYQESLSQGLEKMHRLGVQGEMLFTTLINRWIEQLGREASAIFSSSPLQLPEGHQSTRTNSPQPETLLPLDQPTPVEGTFVPRQSPQPEDWEPIEAQDFEVIGEQVDTSDELETFIQLNIEAPASLLTDEQSNTPNPLNSQDLDFLLGLENEQFPSTPPSAARAGEGEDAEFDDRRREIDELYQSLFGTDSATEPTQAGRSDARVDAETEVTEAQQAATDFADSADNAIANTDAIAPLPSQLQELLFEGLTDPADETLRSPAAREANTPPYQSWEDLLFEDTLAPPTSKVGGTGETQPSSRQVNGLPDTERESQPEGTETITALTDLLAQMDLASAPSAAVSDSLPTATDLPPLAPPTVDTDSPDRPDEDSYIPASPEEDLLSMQDITSDPEREIWLDGDVLQQLQQDLDIFEESLSRNAQTQENSVPPQQNLASPTTAPDIAPANPQPPRVVMTEELLAEDWEEFALDELSDRDNVSGGAGSEHSPTPVPEASVESDFDPDLFPSEALHLDQENVVSASAATPKEPTPPGEAIAIELNDEEFVEMQWDEPADSTTTEETIASDLPAPKPPNSRQDEGMWG